MSFTRYTFFLYLTFFSLPLVATFKGKGTVVLVLMLFLAHAKVLFLKRSVLKERFMTLVKNPIGLCALLFMAWSFISILWSPTPLKSFTSVLRYSSMVGVGFMLHTLMDLMEEKDRKSLTQAFYGGFIFYMVFFLLEIYLYPLASNLYTKSPVFDKRLFIKGIVTLGLLFWPFALHLYRKCQAPLGKRLLWGVVILMILILKEARPSATYLAFFFAAGGTLLIRRFPKAPYLFSMIITLFTLSAPWLFSHTIDVDHFHPKLRLLPKSYQHRLMIWHEMSKVALKKPLIGHGFDHATSLRGGKRVAIFQEKSLIAKHKSWNFTHIFASHPHNGVMQIWVELGLIGILLALGLLWALARHIANHRDPTAQPFLFGLLIYYITINLVGFGLWQKWIGATVILALLCFRAIKNQKV